MNSKDVNSKMKAGQPIPSSEAPKEMPVMNTQPVMNKETVMNIQTAQPAHRGGAEAAGAP